MNRWITIPLAAAALTACVTINVYFPAAEAKEAARQFVEKVIGEDGATPEAEGNDAGGMAAPLMGLFSGLPAGALTEGAAKTGVTPAALGSGYVTFFLYSTVIGVAAIVQAFVVAARQRSLDQAVRQPT